MESSASGLAVAVAIACDIEGKERKIFDEKTMLGALQKYIATPNKHFQPMNANFGILPPLDIRIKDKKERYKKLAERALALI